MTQFYLHSPKEDLGDAINLRFDGHLDKALISQLPEKVRCLYSQFDKDFRIELGQMKHFKKSFYLNRCIPYICALFYDKIICPSYVDEDHKETLLTVFAGQDKEVASEIVTAEETIVEHSENFDMNLGLDLPVQNIVSKFTCSLFKSLKKITNIRKQKILRNISKYHLIEKDESLIDQRIITYAPIYEIHKMIVGYKILFIGKYQRGFAIVKKFTGKYQLFQKDFLKDGTENEKKLSIQKF